MTTGNDAPTSFDTPRMRDLVLQLQTSLPATQPRLDFTRYGVDLPLPNRAFPDDAHPPVRLSQVVLVLDVARNVPIELRLPELGSCCRSGRVAAAFVAMPEASVHEEHGSEARKDKIRSSGKLSAMKPIAKTSSMQRPSQKKLRAGILSADACHHPRPRNGIYHVGHAIFPGDSSPTWYWTGTMTNRLR